MAYSVEINQIEHNTVSEDMFGANNIFTFNRVSGQGGVFDEAVDLLNVTNIRYPGGTVTERHFDVTAPDGPPIGLPETQRFLGITEFLQFANQSDRSVNIVLPTSRFYSGTMDHTNNIPRVLNTSYIQDTLDFVERLITRGDMGGNALPDAKIAAFEIGNEYWGIGLSEAEYGSVVNVLAARLQDLFDRVLGPNATQPTILVQMAEPWGPQFQSSDGIYSDLSWNQRVSVANLNIINQITNPLSIAAIDGLVEHYYSRQTGDFISDTGTSFLNFINTDFAIWASKGFANRDLYITEWNNNINNASQYGLKGASLLLAQMEAMVRMGVDSAYAWPVQSHTTDLAGTIGQQPRLTPVGAAFLLMSESLQGKKLAVSNISRGPLEVDVYFDNSEVVVFASSRSTETQNVEIDLTRLLRSFSSAEGVKISIAIGTNVGDESASAVLTTLSQEDFINSNELIFQLNPFEVLRFTFLNARTQGMSDDDLIIGNAIGEELYGGLGNDSVYGGSSSDLLYGGNGNDLIYGGDGDDILSGGDGVDRLYGGRGEDIILGDSEGNWIYGYEGNDTILVGTGVDTIYGGGGIDAISFELSDVGVEFYLGALSRSVNVPRGIFIDGIEQVIGSARSDILEGDSNRNSFFGSSGYDTIAGFGGRDQIFGGSGFDLIFGDGGRDSLFGDNGDDTLNGGEGDDLIYGGLGADSVLGGIGADLLFGEGGEDFIFGGSGDDYIYGGLGSDVLAGGSGADNFVFRSTSDFGDLIIDFDVSDAISLSRDVFSVVVPFGEIALAWDQTSALGPAFQDSMDTIIFSPEDQTLWMDPDGLGSGKPILVCRFTSGVDPKNLIIDVI